MDLVVLLGTSGNQPASNLKGKGKAGGGGVTKLGLWRMSGSKVWSVEIVGDIRGLTWTHDGE
jgi:hypothetical protein